MGYYSTLTECSGFKVTGMTWDEFQEKWKKIADGDCYLSNYHWGKLNEQDPDSMHVYLECDECYSKHYSDEKLAQFISEVIAESDHCILEFLGEDGPWGFYITKGSVKDIEYAKMVDGERI